MIKCRIMLAAVIACATQSICLGQVRQWSLDDCLNYALENNISLQKSILAVKSASEDRKQSQAALFPTLSFGTNHSLGYNPWINSDVTMVTNGTVNSAKKASFSDNYSLNANWTVWNGNRNRNQVKLNRLLENEAVLDSAVTANNIQELIAQYYIRALYLKEAISVAANSVEVSKANEDRGKNFVEVGNMSKADLAQLTAQRSQDEYSLVEAKSELTTCLVQLKQILELPGHTEFDVLDINATDAQALQQVPALENVYAKALDSRPEIKRGLMAIEGSKLHEKIAKAGYWPSIGLSAGTGTGTSTMGSNSWAQQMKLNFDMQVGLSISIPIFDQRQNKTAVNKAKIQQEQARLDLLDSQKNLYATLESYWEQAITNQQKFIAATANVESMQVSYNLLEEQFTLGLKNVIELMTGKSKLLQAQQNMLQSKYTTILNLQMLKFYQKDYEKN